MSLRYNTLALVATMLTTSVSACRTAAPLDVPQSEGEHPEGVMLVVRNDNYSDMKIFAVRGGQRTRLGTAIGNTSTSFKIAERFYSFGGDMRVDATPIGGNEYASTGTVVVSPGQTIVFTIAPVIRMSAVLLR